MTERKQEDHLMNADLNLNQYGDDSTPANQVAHPWGMNEKYTGEGTKNSNIQYNPNIKTTDLDPEYKYGRDAQLQNSQEAWYIARRNDNIASALYNEWKRSQEEAASFLANQKWWMNGTNEDRINTVNSVWKRIWDIAEQNDKDQTQIEVKEMEADNKAEPKGKEVNVNTFLQWSTTELFWKMITWADTAPYDHNSNEWKQAEARLKQYQRINALSIPQLASSIKAWSILTGWQAMRDLQTYNPEKYQQLQEYQQKEDTMSQVNMIASWKTDDQWLNQKTWEAINNYLNEAVANAGWSTLARMDLNTAIAQNPWVTNYAERMSYYEWLINQIDDTINNLEEDIRKQLSLKTWENVPEYMIQNMLNNRSKKLYKNRDNLKNQYNYYKWLYEAQIEQEATEWERKFKERQLALQENNAEWNQKMDQANLDYKYDQLYSDNVEWTWQWTMRTERNNNPTAMTTNVAKSLWMVEWVDYVQWDAFKTKDGRTLYTAKILWDPIDTTINAFDRAVENGINIFYTQGGKQRRSHTAMTNDQWKSLSKAQKRAVIMNMLKNEGWDISKFTYYNDGSSKKNTTTTTKKTTTSSSSNKTTYTNDELYTKLEQWWITFNDLVKWWNGNEAWEEIIEFVWKKYFEQHPLMLLSDLSETVDKLSKMLTLGGGSKEEREQSLLDATIIAEDMTMNSLRDNKNISNEKKMEMIYKYWEDNFTENDSLIWLLATVLKKQYKTYEELNNALKEIKKNDSKRANFWRNTFSEKLWEKIK